MTTEKLTPEEMERARKLAHSAFLPEAALGERGTREEPSDGES